MGASGYYIVLQGYSLGLEMSAGLVTWSGYELGVNSTPITYHCIDSTQCMQTRSTWRQRVGSGQVFQLTSRVQMADNDSRLDLGSGHKNIVIQ